MLTDPADSFLAGANMVAMCHEQNFASWCVRAHDMTDRSHEMEGAGERGFVVSGGGRPAGLTA